MNITNPLFGIPVLTGLAFVIAGIVMIKFPPEKINSLYGYRTSSSMRTQERWDFSQKYSARQSIKFGTILILSSIVGLIYNVKENTGVIAGLVLTITAVIMLLSKTELAIKTKFGK